MTFYERINVFPCKLRFFRCFRIFKKYFFSFQPLKGFQSNGPGLQYKVSWRQKDVDDEWTSVIVANVSKYIVSGTPTFVPYEIKVQALNDLGYAPEPSEVIGHSGEDCKFYSFTQLC